MTVTTAPATPARQAHGLYCVLRASAHSKLSASTADLASAQALAAEWQARQMGPAVLLPDAERIAAQAAARKRAAAAAALLPDPAAAAAQLTELTRQAEQNALFRLLYRNLPFIACQPGGVVGTCYLVCFDKPYHHARHYLGWSDKLDARLVAHEAGTGSNLMRVVTAAGITWQLARTWPHTDRYFERLLKVRRRSTRMCPRCNPGNHRGIPLAAVMPAGALIQP